MLKIGTISMLAMLALSGVAHSETPYAEPKTAINSLICNTATGVASLYAYHAYNPDDSLANGIKIVDEKDPTANCLTVMSIYQAGEIVDTVDFNGTLLDIRKVKLVARCANNQCYVPIITEVYAVFPFTPST